MMHSTLIVLALLAQPNSTSPNDWTRFRGSSATSVVEERSFPAEWGPEKNVAWKVEVAGSGWSSPIVVGE